MSTLVELQSVDLVYPILSIRAQSIRNSLASLAVGGKLLRDGQDVIHIQALSNVSFQLEEGDSLGLIGHNGSGKTTLLKVIGGIYEPTRGHIHINGRISSMIDVSLGVDPVLTGRENIYSMGRMRGFTTKSIKSNLESMIEFSELGSFIDLPVKTYSSGMVSRLMFSVI
jgi:ABC-type polysaccharide/polyol phosphate transport system ATPase subunit